MPPERSALRLVAVFGFQPSWAVDAYLVLPRGGGTEGASKASASTEAGIRRSSSRPAAAGAARAADPFNPCDEPISSTSLGSDRSVPGATKETELYSHGQLWR
jgi:hypothetical protein